MNKRHTWKYTHRLHYLQTLCLWIHIFAKICCKSQINYQGTFVIIHEPKQNSKKYESPNVHVPTWGQKGDVLLSCFSSHTINLSLFFGLYSATFFSFWCFLLVTSLFKIVPKYSAEVRYKKAVMCHMEKICVLGKRSYRHELQCCWLWAPHEWINNRS